MSTFSILLYRMYFAASDCGVPGMLRQQPWALRSLRQCRALVEQRPSVNQTVPDDDAFGGSHFAEEGILSARGSRRKRTVVNTAGAERP